MTISRLVLVAAATAGTIAAASLRPALAHPGHFGDPVSQVFGSAGQPGGAPPLVPDEVPPNQAVMRLLEGAFLQGEELKDRRVRHGRWTEADLDTPARRARAAAIERRWGDPVFDDEAVPVLLRAEALRRRGEPERALALLEPASVSPPHLRIRAEALFDLGRRPEALAAAEAVIARADEADGGDADARLAAAAAYLLRGRLTEQSEDEWHRILDLCADVRSGIDLLSWEARLLEGELLANKHNRTDAVVALHEALSLNPRLAGAWYALGRIALATFDFDSAELARTQLVELDPDHPLAEMLLAEERLVQDDPAGALAAVERLAERFPGHRGAAAYRAAAAALAWDDEGFGQAVTAFDALAPGDARAHRAAGRFLSMARQYDDAAEKLDEAIRRAPAWGEPRTDLALMETQTGRDARARATLREAVRLDPFNVRARNSLKLLEELAGYETIEVAGFVVRYRAGIDEVLVDLMRERLPVVAAAVEPRFGGAPEVPTVIELMPDHARFAVRITGIPRLFTVAACTGPVVAMEVPRTGLPSEHKGVFDWERVMRHEYAHTVTLERTRNRIPHWLTEGAAVTLETAPRSYEDCVMLAEALRTNSLFSLDEIKWGFVRPRTPRDRALAYAQSQWMYEHIVAEHGREALLELLQQLREGRRQETAWPAALGVTTDAFFRSFLARAELDVTSWGLDPEPPFQELVAELDVPPGGRVENAVTADVVELWRATHPEHPDVLQLALERRIAAAGGPDASMTDDLLAYAKARPVDPWPHRMLAAIAIDEGRPEDALPHFAFLDARVTDRTEWAISMARILRQLERPAEAYDKAMRAIGIEPYDASHRELAAAAAIEAGELDEARRHILALTLLEPGRSIHERRLQRLDEMIGRRPLGGRRAPCDPPAADQWAQSSGMWSAFAGPVASVER